MIWEWCNRVRTFPYQIALCLDDMEMVWDGAIYTAFPWFCYGVKPYHSHTKYYGECMGQHQIHSNPILKTLELKSSGDTAIYGFDIESNNPYKIHILPIAGP